MLHEDRVLLESLRAESLRTGPAITWTAAGSILLDMYRDTIEAYRAAHEKKAAQTAEVVLARQ
jgi:hypothetical protein